MTAPTTKRIMVISGGLSVPSSTRLLADRLIDGTRAALDAAGVTAEFEVVELRNHAHALADAMLTGFPTGELKQVFERLRDADALIAVSPVYAASFGGLFKSFFDVLPQDVLRGVPVLLAATGGTERHSLALEYALRPLFSYLGAHPVPTGVFAATGDWGSPEAAQVLSGRVDRAAAELVAALAGRSEPAVPTGPAVHHPAPVARTALRRVDRNADFIPLAELLAG